VVVSSSSNDRETGMDMTRQNLQVQILGLMALRGAT